MTDTQIIRDGMEFMVLVHRYQKPEDAWGLHKFTPSPQIGDMHCRPFATSYEALRYPDRTDQVTNPAYRHETIGLFRTERKDELIAGWIEIPVPPEIQHYVYTGVIPIEWQSQIREPGNWLRDMVTVLVHE